MSVIAEAYKDVKDMKILKQDLLTLLWLSSQPSILWLDP
jgi:hypothetical protein